MAFLGSTFDASQIEPATPFEVIQPGKYHVQIVNSEMRSTKGGSGGMEWFRMSVRGADGVASVGWSIRPQNSCATVVWISSAPLRLRVFQQVRQSAHASARRGMQARPAGRSSESSH